MGDAGVEGAGGLGVECGSFVGSTVGDGAMVGRGGNVGAMVGRGGSVGFGS